MNQTVELNETALNELLGRAVVDVGAAMHAGLAFIGDQLGLYRALAAAGEAITSAELAERTGTAERYVREWLRAQAAGGYVTYHADSDRYSMTPEQVLVMVDENSPAFLLSNFQTAVGVMRSVPELMHAFRTGNGIGWGAHDHNLFTAVERSFRPGYLENLTTSWIPSLDGIEEKLIAGIEVTDVGCGHGASTIIMAKAFPNSTFIGFDFHTESIMAARERAEAAGVADRVRFEVASAKEFSGGPYDLITVFDCLHDMGDPVGAASHIRSMLKPDGTWMIVEPYASDHVEENLNPIGRIYYSASTMVCTPCSLDQEVGLALGAQAGEGELRNVVEAGGFTRFRRAAETPFNLVLEARP